MPNKNKYVIPTNVNICILIECTRKYTKTDNNTTLQCTHIDIGLRNLYNTHAIINRGNTITIYNNVKEGAQINHTVI